MTQKVTQKQEFVVQRASALLTMLAQKQPPAGLEQTGALAELACRLALALWTELARLGMVEPEDGDGAGPGGHAESTYLKESTT